jgi:hypothetical protein
MAEWSRIIKTYFLVLSCVAVVVLGYFAALAVSEPELLHLKKTSKAKTVSGLLIATVVSFLVFTTDFNIVLCCGGSLANF